MKKLLFFAVLFLSLMLCISCKKEINGYYFKWEPDVYYGDVSEQEKAIDDIAMSVAKASNYPVVGDRMVNLNTKDYATAAQRKHVLEQKIEMAMLDGIHFTRNEVEGGRVINLSCYVYWKLIEVAKKNNETVMSESNKNTSIGNYRYMGND